MRPPRVRKLRRRGDLAGLIDALAYRDMVSLGDGERADAGVSVRLRALEALAELGSPPDAPAIAAALADRDPRVRLTAARVVRALDPEAGADALAVAVVTPPGAEFVEARLEALDVLESLIGRGKSGVARQVAIAAADGGPGVALDQVTQDALTGLVDQAPESEVSAAIDELIGRLPTGNGSRDNAQVILSWLGARSVGSLIGALDREGGFREPAAAVLGAIRDSRALQPLIGVLEDRRADVRRVAAWALGELQDPRTAEALMRATMDEEYAVRRQAGESLDAMGSIALMAGVATMIRSLEERSDRPAVARLVEEGLERAPATSRPRSDGQPRWSPAFVERLRLHRQTA